MLREIGLTVCMHAPRLELGLKELFCSQEMLNEPAPVHMQTSAFPKIRGTF